MYFTSAFYVSQTFVVKCSHKRRTISLSCLRQSGWQLNALPSLWLSFSPDSVHSLSHRLGEFGGIRRATLGRLTDANKFPLSFARQSIALELFAAAVLESFRGGSRISLCIHGWWVLRTCYNIESFKWFALQTKYDKLKSYAGIN